MISEEDINSMVKDYLNAKKAYEAARVDIDHVISEYFSNIDEKSVNK